MGYGLLFACKEIKGNKKIRSGEVILLVGSLPKAKSP
jgi:hypothetical protein